MKSSGATDEYRYLGIMFGPRTEKDVIRMLRTFLGRDPDRLGAVIPKHSPTGDAGKFGERYRLFAVLIEPIEHLRIDGVEYEFDNKFRARHAAEELNNRLHISPDVALKVELRDNNPSDHHEAESAKRIKSVQDRSNNQAEAAGAQDNPIETAQEPSLENKEKKLPSLFGFLIGIVFVALPWAAIFVFFSAVAWVFNFVHTNQFIINAVETGGSVLWIIFLLLTAFYALGFLVAIVFLVAYALTEDKVPLVNKILRWPTKFLQSVFINPVTVGIALFVLAALVLNLLGLTSDRDCTMEYTNSGMVCVP